MSLGRIYRTLVPASIREKIRLGVILRNVKQSLAIQTKIIFSMPLKEKQEKILFRVHLAEHCNLNCAGCDHFSPLAEPELLAIEDFTRDMEQLGRIFHHECREIGLMGGEPLLHPEITSFMKIARDNFSIGRIIIVTNGILLPQKDEDFWQTCHDNNIQVEITHYPIQLDMERINSMSRKFGVEVMWFGQGEKPVEFFGIRSMDLSGSGNYKKNFAMCGRANNCVMLSHGRLFPCTFAPNVHHFNKAFGKNIPVTEADYVDIYQVTDKDTILQRLCTPIPVCRYCDIAAEHTMKWHISEHKIDEWL